jgi:uncharacterized SAM-binding protein YcdF (DUF218 family)
MKMDESRIEQLAQKLWDYHHLNHELEKSEIILAMGSQDLRVAEYAASLYLNGWAPRLLFSGKTGTYTRGVFANSEAETFAEIALQMGVPTEAVWIESESTNTGENLIFSRNLFLAHGIEPKSIILVHKPYMERRAYATCLNFWPGMRVIVTSPPLSFKEYPSHELPRDHVINIMVGDLQRIRVYPEKGFQIEQEIPDDVWQAFEELVSLGFTKHLIKGKES